jgi:hypothetical protein
MNVIASTYVYVHYFICVRVRSWCTSVIPHCAKRQHRAKLCWYFNGLTELRVWGPFLGGETSKQGKTSYTDNRGIPTKSEKMKRANWDGGRGNERDSEDPSSEGNHLGQ